MSDKTVNDCDVTKGQNDDDIDYHKHFLLLVAHNWLSIQHDLNNNICWNYKRRSEISANLILACFSVFVFQDKQKGDEIGKEKNQIYMNKS